MARREIQGLPRADPNRWGDDRALAASLARYLRSGVRSTHEVLTYLRARGVSSTHAARVVGEYRAQGVLDDRAGARLWAEQWARRGYATSAIRLKLSAKGFDDQLIHDTLQRYCPPSDDEERARLVVAQRARHPAPRPAKARLARTLASRGFDSDLIERVLNDSFGPSPADDER